MLTNIRKKLFCNSFDFYKLGKFKTTEQYLLSNAKGNKVTLLFFKSYFQMLLTLFITKCSKMSFWRKPGEKNSHKNKEALLVFHSCHKSYFDNILIF